MIAYKVIISEKALFELSEIRDFISKNSKQNAVKVLNDILEKIESLDQFPQRHEFFRDSKFRKIVVDNHIILYLIDDVNNIVFVNDVFYGKRNR